MVLLIALGGAAFVACGGDSDDDNSDNPTAEQTTDDNGQPTSDGSSSEGGNTNEELQNLAAGMADHEGKIAYDFTSTGGGADSGGSFTLYWKPPDSWRLDIDVEGQVATMIEKEGTTYICSEDGSGGGSCFASPTALPLPFLTYFTDPSTLASLVDTEVGGVDFEESSDSIAGQDVTCYSAEGTVEGETGNAEYCFNDDGLLLRTHGESAGVTFSLEATNVEDSVSDADLDLPYEIVDIPGL